MKRTVVTRLDLGETRIAGFTLFDYETKEFQETTPREVEKLVKAKMVNGLIFDKDGSLVPDTAGWNLKNMKIKSGVGKYRDYSPETARGNTIYSVVGIINTAYSGRVYEIINNRCARLLLSEKQILGLTQFAEVGGIRICEDETIELCEGVYVNHYDDMMELITAEEGSKALEDLHETQKSADNSLFDNMFDNVNWDDIEDEPLVTEKTEPKTMAEVFGVPEPTEEEVREATLESTGSADVKNETGEQQSEDDTSITDVNEGTAESESETSEPKDTNKKSNKKKNHKH